MMYETVLGRKKNNTAQYGSCVLAVCCRRGNCSWEDMSVPATSSSYMNLLPANLLQKSVWHRKTTSRTLTKTKLRRLMFHMPWRSGDVGLAAHQSNVGLTYDGAAEGSARLLVHFLYCWKVSKWQWELWMWRACILVILHQWIAEGCEQALRTVGKGASQCQRVALGPRHLLINGETVLVFSEFNRK